MRIACRLSFWIVIGTMIAMSPAPAPAQETLVDPYTKLGQALSATEATSEPDSKLSWYDAAKLTIEGKGFADTATWSSRLPASSLDKVSTAVRSLASNCAGVAVRFATDSKSISAVWDSVPPMDHMARTGSGGLDLYERKDGAWSYCGTGIARTTRTLAKMGKIRPGKLTEYRLYLPLYSPVKQLKIGVDAGAKLMPAADDRKDRLPVVFYGTSMTQGGCASRSGMSHVAIVGRWLDRDTVNLGFSGAGKSEPVMAELVADIPASLYVLEPLPNMNADDSMVSDRIPVFVKTIRAKRPDTPILLVQNPLSSNTSKQNTSLSKVFEDLKKAGVRNLSLLPSKGQLDGRENGTVDGVHPTDLGFNRMAECYYPVVKQLIGEK
jgi:hypothetical protein